VMDENNLGILVNGLVFVLSIVLIDGVFDG
jgi:hypothetical protein